MMMNGLGLGYSKRSRSGHLMSICRNMAALPQKPLTINKYITYINQQLCSILQGEVECPIGCYLVVQLKFSPRIGCGPCFPSSVIILILMILLLLIIIITSNVMGIMSEEIFSSSTFKSRDFQYSSSYIR